MTEYLRLLLNTDSAWIGFSARLVLGLILLPHGCQKMFGWFGGEGFELTIQRFHKGMELPWIIALLIILIEFFASVFLLLGFASRLMAFSIFVLMIGTIVTVHWQYGYFLNWHNTKGGEGMQFNLLMMGLCIVVMLAGSGSLSIDKLLFPE